MEMADSFVFWVSSRRILLYLALLSLALRVYGAMPDDDDQLFLRRVESEISKRIVVDASGKGDFKTVQAAIDSVPANNRRWIMIVIRAGIYSEKVKILEEKPFIFLKGVGRYRTTVAWGDTAAKVGTFESATFTLSASNFIAKGISFKNTFQPGGSVGSSPAVAALISGNNTAFYGCGFSSIQDTLCDLKGKHFFKDCNIQGAVDFIFGAGQSIYKNCTIISTAVTEGWITAQSRENNQDSINSGYVFDGCRVVGTGKVFLGRPWRSLARVIFTNTYMSDIVNPQGWDSWGRPTSQLVYAEHNCYGPGSESSQRVKWEKKLSDEDVAFYTSPNFIDLKGWAKPQHNSFARQVRTHHPSSPVHGSFQ